MLYGCGRVVVLGTVSTSLPGLTDADLKTTFSLSTDDVRDGWLCQWCRAEPRVSCFPPAIWVLSCNVQCVVWGAALLLPGVFCVPSVLLLSC